MESQITYEDSSEYCILDYYDRIRSKLIIISYFTSNNHKSEGISKCPFIVISMKYNCRITVSFWKLSHWEG